MVKDYGRVVYTLLYVKWMTNKDLFCNTGNSAQSCLPAWMGGRVLGENGSMCPFTARLKLSHHC